MGDMGQARAAGDGGQTAPKRRVRSMLVTMTRRKRKAETMSLTSSASLSAEITPMVSTPSISPRALKARRARGR